MVNQATTNNLAHPFLPVKYEVNSQLPLFPDSMTHHNRGTPKRKFLIVTYKKGIDRRYGVSSCQRSLPKGLFIKKLDYIRDCLKYVLKLSPKEVTTALALLRLASYYNHVYPKASQIAGETEISGPMTAWRASLGLNPLNRTQDCSRSTVWRTIRHLEDAGLLTRVNRYILRPHAQISNLYKLDKLVLTIVRYLTEHIEHLWPDWLDPIIFMKWPQWWQAIRTDQPKLPNPCAGAHTGF